MTASLGERAMQQEVVGRGPELAAIDRLLEHATTGLAALLITGEPGIGKTTLWQAAQSAAMGRGHGVLAARPAQSESRLPLSAFGDLFAAAAPAVIDRLPAPQREALEVALLRTSPSRAHAGHRALAVATTSLLRELAGDRGPLLVAVDDAQWLDASSASLLDYALRRVADRPVALLVCRRAAPATPEPLALDHLRGAGRVEELLVGPLSVAALHRLLLSRLGTSFSRLALVRIEALSAGNAFYALEIGRALLRSGAPVRAGDTLAITGSLGELMRERIDAMPPRTRDALLVAAVSLEPAGVATLRAAGIAEPEAALAPALADGIVSVEDGRIRFSHPLLVASVRSGAADERIRATHRVLAAAAASEDARAQHRALASDGPDESAAQALDGAATRARLRGAPFAAGELLELAAALSPAVAGRRERVQRAALCYFEAGEALRAGELLGALLQSEPHGPGRAAALRLLAQVRARSHSMEEARRLAAEALQEPDGEPALRAGIEVDLAVYSFSLSDLPGSAFHAAQALPLADASASASLRSEAMAGLSMAEFWLGGGVAEERMAVALALEDPWSLAPLELRPRFVQGLLWLWTARLDDAMRILLDLRSELIAHGHDTPLPFLDLFLVIAALWRSDVAGAARFAAEARENATLSGDPVAGAVATSACALVDSRRGRADAVRDEAGTALALLMQTNWTIYLTWPLWSLALLELSLDNPAAVDELLRPLAETVTAIEGTEPILGVVLPDEIEALVALGDLERARRYAAWIERGGTRLDRPWALAAAARSRALIAAAEGDLAAAADELEHALAQHDRLPMPIERARTLLVKGRVHRRRREKRLAEVALRESLRLFDEAEAPLWSERVHAELARVGTGHRGMSELTATERRVAELAASGLGNREIADQAFLTTKGVEANLTRVYRKLGIRSRGGLARALAGRAARPGDRGAKP